MIAVKVFVQGEFMISITESYWSIIIWLRLVADITRALIAYERSLSGHYAAVMPTGRLRIMQIRKSSALTIYAP